MTVRERLRIDSHVVVQLGAELISDSEQALLELVKNAYDADATKCVIVIEPDWEPKQSDEWRDYLFNWKKKRNSLSIGRIVVLDNGTGLDSSAVRNGWLFISASLKRQATGAKIPTLERNRTPVGDKGLGRLATMRLGEVLRLKTMLVKETKARTVSFAWGSFHSGAALEDVEVKSGTDEKLNSRNRGTDIEILGMSEPGYWSNEQNIYSMLSKLSSLVSPFKKFKDFQVNVRASGQEHDLQAISSEALNFSSAKFEFSFDSKYLEIKAYISKSLFRGQSGEVNRRLFDELFSESNLESVVSFIASHSRVSSRSFKDLRKAPGGWLFSLQDRIKWEDIPRDPKLVGASNPGPFVGEIYNFLFNDQTKEQLMAANVPLPLLQGMTTIGMFRDGFRVRMNDDWLELAKSSTSGGFFQLRPRNVIGYFEITNRENSSLVEKSDREGFVDNESWRGFMLLANRTKKFANDALDSVRTAYDEYKKSVASRARDIVPAVESKERHIATQQKTAQHSLKKLMDRSDELSVRISEASRLAIKILGNSNSNEIVKELNEIADGLEDVRDKVEVATEATASGFSVAGELAIAQEHLEERNLRLLDAAAVGLSARALVHEVNTHLQQLTRAVNVIASVNKKEPSERVSDALSSISDVIRELKKSVATIDPLTPGSRTLKDNFEVGDFIDKFLKSRASRLEAARTSISLSCKSDLFIRFSRSRFTQILENLLLNSLYWIEEQSDDLPLREISVVVHENGFDWSDSAKGVREALEESLFDPYVTDKPESKGQGLGLFIVSSFLQAEKSSIGLLLKRNSFNRRYIFRVDLSGARRS